MAQAAVPGYLGTDFSDCPPGHRFTLYGAFWEQAQGWKRVDPIVPKEHLKPGFGQFPDDVRRLGDALRARQCTLAEHVDPLRIAVFEAQSVAPFVTGTGIEHPLENGMAFLNPYGLPYLPGSGVKGVLRRSAQELKDGSWGHNDGWNAAAIEALFGCEPPPGDERQCRGALTFWDVIPACERLVVDIMNPHYGDYYQAKTSPAYPGGATPHDAGNPVPIYFLTVPERTAFAFHVVYDPSRGRAGPDLAATWRALLEAAFAHAFDWLGFGAKTAVGYGQLQADEKARDEREARVRVLQAQRKAKEDLEKAIRGLPEDATWIEKKKLSGTWGDRDVFLRDLTELLEKEQSLTPQAHERLKEELERLWPGILGDPDATQGKKKKPKFKERPKALAKRLLALGH
ncbi:MAG: type III-B CRISPR module RAMP protein Cmr6 [Gammaproteobacteria bacterium]|nr:type III-B CRISPR module RAMP protein Cmr6 [Gammaproteobacteria bacterium]